MPQNRGSVFVSVCIFFLIRIDRANGFNKNTSSCSVCEFVPSTLGPAFAHFDVYLTYHAVVAVNTPTNTRWAQDRATRLSKKKKKTLTPTADSNRP